MGLTDSTRTLVVTCYNRVGVVSGTDWMGILVRGTLGQAFGFLLLRRRFRYAGRQLINFSHPLMRFRRLRPQLRGFLKIPERLGILVSPLTLLCKCERDAIEKIGGPAILGVELVGMVQRDVTLLSLS